MTKLESTTECDWKTAENSIVRIMFQPHSVIDSTIIIIEAAVRACLSDRVGRTGNSDAEQKYTDYK